MQRTPGRLAAEVFDVLVIGAGIHGAWIALRAAQAGYRVALIERDDFGAATSANSLKILHGGLRYLQNLDLLRMRSSICARRESAGLRHIWFIRCNAGSSCAIAASAAHG
jgi:glycerol-3-phosphate dehydrogenase